MQFQIDVAKAFNHAWKEASSKPRSTDQDLVMPRLEHWPCSTVWKPTMPQFDDRILAACYFTASFTHALATWLCQLEWPVNCDEADPGVTCLELYVSFQYFTGLRTPL